MEEATRTSAIVKLARMGIEAGFSIDQMIQLLEDGLEVEALVDIIVWILKRDYGPVVPLSLSHRPCTRGVEQPCVEN